MKCPNCNNEVTDNSQYCKRCGKKIENNHDNQYLYSELYSNIYKPTVTSDEDYIKAYIGTSYENVKKESFSLIAFILGPFYLLLKNVYTLASLLLLITFGIYTYDKDIASIFYIIISGYIGLKGTSMYLQHSTRKVEEIKISNPDKTSTEILEICKKEGKPKQKKLFLLIILIIITIYIINIYVKNKVIDSDIMKYNQSETTAYTIKDMNFELLSELKPMTITGNYWNYQYKDEHNNCHITIIVDKFSPIYNTVDEYIEKNVYINPNSDTVINISKDVHNSSFLVKEINNENTKRIVLFKVFNNYMYNIEYSANTNYSNRKCDASIATFLETASFNQEKEQ